MILSLGKTTIGFLRREDGWTNCVKGWGSHKSQKP